MPGGVGGGGREAPPYPDSGRKRFRNVNGGRPLKGDHNANALKGKQHSKKGVSLDATNS